MTLILACYAVILICGLFYSLESLWFTVAAPAAVAAYLIWPDAALVAFIGATAVVLTLNALKGDTQ